MLSHASCLTRQGVWTHWDDVQPFDLSWNNLIYGPGPRVIAFVLNAQINSVKTPDMMKLWGYASQQMYPSSFWSAVSLHLSKVGTRGDMIRLRKLISDVNQRT